MSEIRDMLDAMARVREAAAGRAASERALYANPRDAERLAPAANLFGMRVEQSAFLQSGQVLMVNTAAHVPAHGARVVTPLLLKPRTRTKETPCPR